MIILYTEGLIMSYRVLRYAALGKQIFQKISFYLISGMHQRVFYA